MTRLVIRLTPKSRQEAIEGWGQDEMGRAYLKLRVREAPIEGQANQAMISFLAKRLHIPKSKITLLSGETSRLKQLEIEGFTEAELEDLISRELKTPKA